MSKYVPRALRRRTEQHANGLCEYCLSPSDYSPQTFECEHIIPLSRGGQSVQGNLAWSCGGCNRLKATHISAIDPKSAENVALFNPRQFHWHAHFTWSDDYAQLIGKTASGRATIELLQLNRLSVQNLRRLLLSQDLHPPAKFC